MQGLYYTRVRNPTRDALEKCLAALDNGKYGMVYPSGMAAATALLQFLKNGDHIVSCNELYGGTHFLLSKHTKLHGIELNFVDATDVKQIESAIKPNTKVFTYSLHLFSSFLYKFSQKKFTCSFIFLS